MPFNIAGGSRLRNMRDQAIRQARRQFDPNVLDPQRSEFQRQATQGIGRMGDTAREGAVSQMFSPTQFQSFAGNQGRALSAQQDLQGQQATALAQFERGLSEQDIQTRQQGRQGVAQAESQQRQIQAQQDAAIEQAELQYQAERDRRRQQMVGAGLGIAGSLLTTPFGGGEVSDIMDDEGNVIGRETTPSRSILERGLGRLFGSSSDELAPVERQGGSGQGMERFNQLSNFIGSGEQPTGSGGMERFNQLAGFLSDGMVQPMEDTSLEGMRPVLEHFGYDFDSEQQMRQHQLSDMGAGGGERFNELSQFMGENFEQGQFSATDLEEVQQMRNYLRTDQGREDTFGQEPLTTEQLFEQFTQFREQAGEDIMGERPTYPWDSREGSLGDQFRAVGRNIATAGEQIRRRVAPTEQEMFEDFLSRNNIQLPQEQGEGQSMSDFNLEQFADTVGQFEGFSETAYPDTLRGEDVPTIGYGTTRYPDGSPVQMGDEISPEQAREFKLQDLQQSMEDAQRIVPNFNELPDEAKGVVIDMIYNLGATGFSRFENMIDALTQNDFARAAQEAQNSDWFNQVGNRARTHIDTLSNLAQ